MVELKGRLDITEEIISELEDASKFNQNATQRGNKVNKFEREFKEYDQAIGAVGRMSGSGTVPSPGLGSPLAPCRFTHYFVLGGIHNWL